MAVVLNGETYDESDFTGLGYVDIFPSAIFTDMLAELQDWLDEVTDQAIAAAASAAAADASADAAALSAISAAAAASELQGTSTTSLTIGSGTKTLTTQTGKSFIVGMPLRYARTADPGAKWMDGICTEYNSGTGSLSILVGAVDGTDFEGSGATHSDWTISFIGDQGPPGADGESGTNAWAAPVTITAGTTTPTAGLTQGVIYIADVSGGDVEIDLVNSPPGVLVKLLQNGYISSSNRVIIKPPSGKKVMNQTADDRVTRQTNFEGWALFKDTNGDYS